MNHRMIAYLSGVIILIEAVFLALPALVSLIYAEQSGVWFLVTMAIAGAVGLGLVSLRPRKRDMYAKEGFVVTALGWISISLIGAIPFRLSGQIPNYLDAVFETVSGFTTTGASILPNVELLDHGMLFWRSFTHWLGGMGILVFMLAVMNMGSGQSNHLLRAESPGPSVSKMVPNMRRSAAILYGIYIAMTVLQIVLMLLGGMPLFDSLCTAFGTAGTGGFGVKVDSIAGYSHYLQTVIAVFMVLFGINFNIYFFLLMKKFSMVFRNTEVWVYLGIVLTTTLIIGSNILSMMPGVYEAFHHAFFTVASIITTTGFATVDFDLWPELSRVLLVLLMIVGACAGSTGGGVKVSRVVMIFKAAAFEVRKLLHPGSVKVLMVDGKRISRETIEGVHSYMTVYFAITVLSILLVSLDGHDLITTVTAVEATLNNIGPGLGLVGPTGNFAFMSPLSKVVLTADMLLGRLELFPILILLMPSTWRKN